MAVERVVYGTAVVVSVQVMLQVPGAGVLHVCRCGDTHSLKLNCWRFVDGWALWAFEHCSRVDWESVFAHYYVERALC